MFESNFHKHPEWKRLLDEIKPLLGDKRDWEYAELSAVAGVDIRSNTGRKQFLRFRREASKLWNIWFENVRGKGYRIVKGAEHAGCSVRRAKAGRRRFKDARMIAANCRLEELTDQQKFHNTLLVHGYDLVLTALGKQTREIQRLAAVIESPKLLEAQTVVDRMTELKQAKVH
jgi:hypothetical protein